MPFVPVYWLFTRLRTRWLRHLPHLPVLYAVTFRLRLRLRFLYFVLLVLCLCCYLAGWFYTYVGSRCGSRTTHCLGWLLHNTHGFTHGCLRCPRTFLRARLSRTLYALHTDYLTFTPHPTPPRLPFPDVPTVAGCLPYYPPLRVHTPRD